MPSSTPPMAEPSCTNQSSARGLPSLRSNPPNAVEVGDGSGAIPLTDLFVDAMAKSDRFSRTGGRSIHESFSRHLDSLTGGYREMSLLDTIDRALALGHRTTVTCTEGEGDHNQGENEESPSQ